MADIPPVLLEIGAYLSARDVSLTSSVDTRLDSAINEEHVLENIAREFPIKQQKQVRHWWDFSIIDSDVLLPVNLKLTELKSANDNVNCKLGIYYALTGQAPEFANEIPWLNFFRHLSENMQENDKDYYFLVVNKNNTGDVFVQGLKTLQSLSSSGSNLPFQCCWRDNREVKSRSFDEACDFLLSTIADSIKLRANIDDEFRQYFPEYWKKSHEC